MNKKERPILFSAPMVLALLDGSKTQTRRIMKPQPTISESGWFSWDGYEPGSKYGAYAASHIDKESIDIFVGSCCPHGKPGDQLWVRETFSVVAFAASQEYHTEAGMDSDGAGCKVKYHADNAELNIIELSTENGRGASEEEQAFRASKKKTVPSIHMPRWASRIQLEIVNVRVERLNVISEADAMAEGAKKALCSGYPYQNPPSTCVNGFSHLWKSINGSESWNENPWVWVVEFKRAIKP